MIQIQPTPQRQNPLADKPTGRPPNRIRVTPFELIIDTREQAPWYFSDIPIDDKHIWLPRIVRRNLDTGDYSIEGLESLLTIERKSLSDLYGSAGRERARFEREHERMAAIIAAGGRACVIIEADSSEAMLRPPPESSLPPQSVMGTAASWYLRYGVPWFFEGSRRLAELKAFHLLEKFYRYQQEANAVKEG